MTGSYIHRVGPGITPFSGVDLEVFYAVLDSKRPKVNLRSPRGQRGSHFHIWVQNPLKVLTTKFHPYPINTSQVIPFLKSIINFYGKRLLIPEGVAGEFSLTRSLFSRFVSYVHCRKKFIMPPSIVLRELPIFGLEG